MSEEQPPIVEYSNITSNDEAVRTRAGRAIAGAYKKFGLYYLRFDAGAFPTAQQRHLMSLLDYYCLPEEVRRGHMIPDIWGQRGFAEGEQAVGSEHLDRKGWYFINPAYPGPEDAIVLQENWPPLYPENRWFDDLPDGFKDNYIQFSMSLHSASRHSLAALELGLELPPGTLTKNIVNGPHCTRGLIYYPLPAGQNLGKTPWGGLHTDFNLETVLGGGMWFDEELNPCDRPEDPNAGLHIKLKNGRTIRGATPPGCIALQCGQQLEAIAIKHGLELTATPHYIVPPKQPGKGRVSIAHFTHLNPNLRLGPLEGFIADQLKSPLGHEISVGEFDLRTLHRIGLSGMNNDVFEAYLQRVLESNGYN